MMTVERQIASVARVQHGVISRQQALSEGMSSSAIARRVASGEWIQVFQGSYRLAGAPCTYEQRLMAACLAAGPDAVGSYRAAGALLHMPGVPRWVEVTVPYPRQVSTQGLIVHRSRLLAPEDIGRIRAIPVTRASRTFVDLADLYEKPRLGRLLDNGMARQLFTRRELIARMDALGTAGRSRSRVLALLLEERPNILRPIGSEMEALLFHGLRKGGVACPVPQYRVLMPDGTEVFLDFAYPDVYLDLEMDSYLWHASLEAWQRDRARNGELVAMGWSILPVTANQVRYELTAVVDRVRRALASRNHAGERPA